MFEEHKHLLEEAKKLFAGGITAYTRAHQGLLHPFYVRCAEGAWLEDIVGNRFIDLCMSNGAALLGHGQPSPSQDTDFWGYESPWILELGKRIQNYYPDMDLMRFCLSGTEAVHHAICLARISTKRRLFAKFAGHYHGNCDPLQANWIDYGEQPRSDGTCKLRLETTGIHPDVINDIVVLPFNDFEALERFFRTYGNYLAGIFVEPTAINAGCLSAQPGFLEEIRRKCNESGCLLIYDEILCGFRCSSPIKARPDLTLLGKIVGGGYPLSVIGGQERYMRLFSQGYFHSGTHTASAFLAKRACMSLDALSPKVIQTIKTRAEKFLVSLNEMFSTHKLYVRIEQSTDRFAIFFDHEPNKCIVRPNTTPKERELLARFSQLACANGVFMRPQIHHGISIFHDEEVIDETLKRLKPALVAFSKGIR